MLFAMGATNRSVIDARGVSCGPGDGEDRNGPLDHVPPAEIVAVVQTLAGDDVHVAAVRPGQVMVLGMRRELLHG